MPEPVVVIEQTSKRWKGLQAVGCLGALVGLFLAFGGSGFGFLLLLLGLAVYVVARVGAWWKHG